GNALHALDLTAVIAIGEAQQHGGHVATGEGLHQAEGHGLRVSDGRGDEHQAGGGGCVCHLARKRPVATSNVKTASPATRLQKAEPTPNRVRLEAATAKAMTAAKRCVSEDMDCASAPVSEPTRPSPATAMIRALGMATTSASSSPAQPATASQRAP